MSYLSEAGIPAIPQWVFGTSVTMTLMLSLGAFKVSSTVLVRFLISSVTFSGGLPSIIWTLISGIFHHPFFKIGILIGYCKGYFTKSIKLPVDDIPIFQHN